MGLKKKTKEQKKIYITKKREQMLNEWLSVDDFLYAKFKRLREELSEREHRFFKKKNNFRVISRDERGNLYMEKLISLRNLGDGFEIYIEK